MEGFVKLLIWTGIGCKYKGNCEATFQRAVDISLVLFVGNN